MADMDKKIKEADLRIEITEKSSRAGCGTIVCKGCDNETTFSFTAKPLYDSLQTRIKQLEEQVDACKNVISFARSELRQITDKDVHILSALAVLPEFSKKGDSNG